MKSLLFAALLCALSVPALADTYAVTFGGTDPTLYQTGEVPSYEAKWRVAGGAETVIPALTAPGGATTVTATPGDAIDVALRACNGENGEICGAWSAWVTATAQHPPTVPAQMTGITITVVRSGP